MHRELSAAIKAVADPSFLPPLENPIVFDILVYTSNGALIPDGWEPTHTHAIPEGEAEYGNVNGLKATRHQVTLSLSYREEE